MVPTTNMPGNYLLSYLAVAFLMEFQNPGLDSLCFTEHLSMNDFFRLFSYSFNPTFAVSQKNKADNQAQFCYG